MPLIEPLSTHCLLSLEETEPLFLPLLHLGADEAALAVVVRAQDTFGATASLLQAKGEALMHLQMWQRALEAFSQADLLQPDNLHRLHLVAQCYEALGSWPAAITSLTKIKEAEPDADVDGELAHCLIQAQRWDEAANCLFRMEFEGDTSRRTRRAIAWCSLHQGKLGRAAQYYSALTDTPRPQWTDLLHLGHTLVLDGKRLEAIEAYRSSAVRFSKAKNRHSFRHWSQAFSESAAEILAPHLTPGTIAVLADAVAAEPSGSE